MAVAWATSNPSVATVDNGEVTAVGGGQCEITASFEYQGSTYSDTCSVTVEAGVNLTPFFSAWNESDYWVQLQYTQNDRKTYIAEGSEGFCEFVNNPDAASSTSLFMDIRPVAQTFVEAGKRYTLLCEVEGENVNAAIETNMHEDNQLTPVDGRQQIAVGDGSIVRIPYDATHADAPRLLTLQLRTSSNVAFTGRLRLSLYEGDYQGGYTPPMV